MTVLALIPARGGSKGIPRKNIQPFCKKPLLQWSIDAALSASCVDQVVVTTDDPKIADIAKAGGAEVPFLRPPELATDEAPGIAPVLHALERLDEVTDILLLQPTSPLRTSGDIDEIFALRHQQGKDSAVSLTKSNKHPAWMFSLTQKQQLKPLIETKSAFRRQDLPATYVLNGAIYLASRDFLQKELSFIGKDTVGYVMPFERSVDIDTPSDWLWAEFLMNKCKY